MSGFQLTLEFDSYGCSQWFESQTEAEAFLESAKKDPSLKSWHLERIVTTLISKGPT